MGTSKEFYDSAFLAKQIKYYLSLPENNADISFQWNMNDWVMAVNDIYLVFLNVTVRR